jgi:tetratricopeptide (TPR) repeat protein
MSMLRSCAVALAVVGCLVVVRPGARGFDAVSWLERYAAGEFEAVADDLQNVTDYEGLLRGLTTEGPAWIEAGGEAGRARRRLVAATFALEAARAGAWREWKWVQQPPAGPLPILSWRPPPLLLEWACDLFAQDEKPAEAERLWQLAALSVVQRSEDAQFQVGNTEVEGGGFAAEQAARPVPPGGRRFTRPHPDEVVNPKREIGHLMHTTERFPEERRFLLAQGLARERFTPRDAMKIYSALGDDPRLGGEARMRLAALHLRQNRAGDAIDELERAERLTRDPYVTHLIFVLRGQALLRSRQPAPALAALETALEVWPGAQSASILLADQLVRADRWADAQRVMARVLAQGPPPFDPFIEMAHADDRFWPEHIRRLRAEIRR